MAVESNGRALVAVLAAGASRRMGAPKLLLPYLDSKGSKTCLLERACAAACASRASGVAVVCGPNVDEVRAVVGRCASGCAGGCEAGRPSVLVNGAWETGQASSVACAARAALEGGFDALVVMTADQPFVEARHLDALMTAHAGAAPEDADGFSTAGPDGHAVYALRASRGGRGGNPCLFPRAALPLLLDLGGDEGARRLFASGALAANPVAFDGPDDGRIFFDVDEPGDFEEFLAVVGGRSVGAIAEADRGAPHAATAPDVANAGGAAGDAVAPGAPCPRRDGQTFDPAALRGDFPLLDRIVGANGETVCYLDSAATSLVPEPVRRRVDAYLTTSCANIHRGAHLLAEESTDAYETAREHVARFIGAADPAQVIFTHGATESLNLVAQCWAAANLSPGDTVLLTEDAHHAAIVPFQMLAERAGVAVRFVRVAPDGLLDESSWEACLAVRPKLVVLTHTGNVLGFSQPLLGMLAREARERGALVALDAAQAVGHVPFAVDERVFDFVAFSAHKMHALTGLGVLWCSRRALAAMRPALGGGGMIERVTVEGYAPAPVPAAFEPGTPAVAAAVSLDAALDYLEGVGMENLARHGAALCRRAVEGLRSVPGVRVLGPREAARSSLVSFTVDGVHPHDVGARLSEHGVMVRAGHHCAMPLHRVLGVPASVRASFAAHTTEKDVDRLVDAVRALVDER